MPHGNVELVRSAYDAFNRGDIPAVVGTLDPERGLLAKTRAAFCTASPYAGNQRPLTCQIDRASDLVHPLVP